MPKYQIILESDEILDDEEFAKKAEALLYMYNGEDEIIDSFKLLYAQSLEGIKRELWEKKEELKKELEDHAMKSDSEIDSENYFIEKNFKAISDLFKLY